MFYFIILLWIGPTGHVRNGKLSHFQTLAECERNAVFATRMMRGPYYRTKWSCQKKMDLAPQAKGGAR